MPDLSMPAHGGDAATPRTNGGTSLTGLLPNLSELADRTALARNSITGTGLHTKVVEDILRDVEGQQRAVVTHLTATTDALEGLATVMHADGLKDEARQVRLYVQCLRDLYVPGQSVTVGAVAMPVFVPARFETVTTDRVIDLRDEDDR